MKLFAFLFLALVVTSHANQALLKGLSKLNSHPTGAAILSAISLNLKAKTPLGDIASLLNEILNEQLAESQTFESQIAEKAEQLNEAISVATSTEDLLQTTIGRAQADVDAAQTSLAADQDSLEQANQDVAVQQQIVADSQSALASELPELDADIASYQDAIEAVNQAVSKMNDYQRSNQAASIFVQLTSGAKDKIKNVAEKINNMRKKLAKHSNMFTPLARELIDLSTTLDQSKADKVVELLNQLGDLLTQSLANTQAWRSTRENSLNEAINNANDAITTLNANINGLEQSITNLNQQIDNDQNTIAYAQDLAAKNQVILQAARDALDAVEADFAARKPIFESLISLIRNAITYFEQNLKEVDDFVGGVVNN